VNLLDFLSKENRLKNTRWLDEKSRQFHQFMNSAFPRNPKDQGHALQPVMGLMETLSPATDIVDMQKSSGGLMDEVYGALNESGRASKINALGQGANLLASTISLGLPGNLVRTYDDLSKNIVSNFDKFKNVKVDPFDDVSKAEKIKPLSKKPNIENALIKKYPNIDLDIYETDKGLTLSKIVLPKDDRNKGIGSKILEDLTAYADKNNLTIGVTPDSTFGGNKNKLKSFYKKFGFLDNKGRNKDFTFRETMVRQPFEIKLNPAQQQSQDIINLLESGKANEVTDQMLANADQKYLFENYDLPMDTKSRMARAKEMGLLDDSFHGTSKSYDSQNYPTNTSDDIKTPMGDYGNAFFSSNNPNVANTYGDIIYPIKTRPKDAKYNVDAKGKNWHLIPLNNELEMDFGLALGNEPTSTNMIVDLVNANRPDIKQVKFDNVIDRGSSYPKNLKGNTSINEPSTVTASLMDHDPLVRSKFARFDPRLKHLKNLSAGLIPIGLLPFLSNNEGLEDDRPY